MPQPFDRYRPRRQQLLAGVSAWLREFCIQAAFSALIPYYDLYGAAPETSTVRHPMA
ncbi:hypothetical protein GCM10010170_113510 [Dactylosporangium salmoneum]|uniref:Uncharacterized protein n=1 Tax=Dactylosporangium salmoneum TaxID=53361 RepID=A0ABP5V9E3_9ACTN